MSNDQEKNYAEMNSAMQRLFGNCPTFENEEEAFNYLTQHSKLLEPTSRAFAEGGSVAEVLARFAEYAVRDRAVAHEAGKDRGRAWAREQDSWDARWLSLDIHSGEVLFVEVELCDLARSMRDRDYGFCYMEAYMSAFMEGAQEYFRRIGEY